ncbi:MAG: hypothetical protein [Circular genetic element sp.]|nr:MAG: hypothetical protein [Circular genetic element sp.]
MRKEFVMRGQTASGSTEVLNFGKYKAGYAYKMTEFSLWGSTGLGTATAEMWATITAGKTAVAPTDPNFNDDGLIGTSHFFFSSAQPTVTDVSSVINDTYVITQNLILMVIDSAGAGAPVNWQCRFESVKMTGAEEAAVNYKQFTISDE